MTFFDTAACQSRAFCRQCRSSPAYRQSLVRAGQVESEEFACPHGFTSENLPSLLTSQNRMNVIRDTSTVPSTGWQYPGIGGYIVHTHNYSLLYSLVREHYEANGAPLPSEQDVIDYCCTHLYVPCYSSETRQPLVNLFSQGLPPKARGCCGS